MSWIIFWSMIFSENRDPLFGIMLCMKAREQRDEKAERRRRVAMLLRRDLVQRGDRKPAVRQVRVDRIEAKRTHARHTAVALQARQQAPQLVDDGGAVSSCEGKRREGHGYAVRDQFSDLRV